MAYSWNGTSSRLTISGSPATPDWNAGSLWFYPTDDTLADQVLLARVNTTGTAWYGVWYGSTSAADKVYFGNSGIGSAQSGSAATLNAWNHVYWSFNSTVSPSLYEISLNGEALQTAVFTPPATATTAATCLGFLRVGTLGPHTNWFKGYMAEVSLFSDVMDVAYGDRYTALAKRWSPLRIMPHDAALGSGLSHHWGLRGKLVDHIGGRTFGSTSPPTVIAEHPSIRYPSSGKLILS